MSRWRKSDPGFMDRSSGSVVALFTRPLWQRGEGMTTSYVHGYTPRETRRLTDQAGTLAELLHGGTTYPAGSRVLEVGCGVGAQTEHLVARSPGAWIVA